MVQWRLRKDLHQHMTTQRLQLGIRKKKHKGKHKPIKEYICEFDHTRAALKTKSAASTENTSKYRNRNDQFTLKSDEYFNHVNFSFNIVCS